MCLPKKRGIIGERFLENDIVVPNNNQEEGATQVGGGFTLRLQSGSRSRENANSILAFLKDHPIVSLDPGVRWAVRGVICKVKSYSIHHEDTYDHVSVRCDYRSIRLSGHKFQTYQLDPDIEEQHNSALMDLLLSEEFKKLDRKEQISTLCNVEQMQEKIKEYETHITSRTPVLQKEALRLHQTRMALNFIKRISHLCQGSGDPIVLMGDQGGGGHGRAQVNHHLLAQTIAGFFGVIRINEYMTTRLTPCCHKEAYAPKYLGRSRKCKDCGGYWDRDMGASW